MNTMGEIKDQNSKAASQAWRRKPRKFAPKSRLGCKTCKIRRVKCDLSRPSCIKCQSTGRTCDGYSDMPLASKAEVESTPYYEEKANRAERRNKYQPCTMISAFQPKQMHAKYHGPISRNLGPFIILPVAAPAQAEAMWFFEYISFKYLNEYQPCESWRTTLMYFSQTVPSVRYAAIALALVYRNYLDRHSSGYVHQPQSPKDWRPDNTPLLYYNRAIQLLLNQETGDSTDMIAITLLVCYLFTCFDHLAGNYVQAMKHLRGGVELSRHVERRILNNNNLYNDTKPSGAHTLMYQVTRQIRRLDMQAVTFLVDWTPTDIQEISMSRLQPFNSVFQSLDQAADHLHILVARVMGLRNMEQQMSQAGRTPPPPMKDIVLRQLETWSRLFENMLQQSSSHEANSETYPFVSLLRLQHTIAWILLSSYGSGRELDYDEFLPQFQQCMALARDVAAAHEQHSGSLKPTFTPEVGIVPVLYIIGAKCRHPVVRREVLSILRRQPIREAVWDSISAARVVERIIEIEEAVSEGETVRSMEQIAVWRRIETLSWVHVVNGQFAPRLDITYTFCAREGAYTESLAI